MLNRKLERYKTTDARNDLDIHILNKYLYNTILYINRFVLFFSLLNIEMKLMVIKD